MPELNVFTSDQWFLTTGLICTSPPRGHLANSWLEWGLLLLLSRISRVWLWLTSRRAGILPSTHQCTGQSPQQRAVLPQSQQCQGWKTLLWTKENPSSWAVRTRVIEPGSPVSVTSRRSRRDFLVVQWLRLSAPEAEGLNSIPSWETRSHMPQLRPGATKQINVCVCVCVCTRARMCACAQTHCHVRLFGTPWTVACQAPLPMEFSRQGYWSGVPFPTSRDLSDPRMEPTSLVSPALVGGFFTTGTTWEAPSK